MQQAICSRCGTPKPVGEFAIDRAKASGHKSWCKVCDNARSGSYYWRNRDRKLASAKARQRAKPKRQRMCTNCGQPATSQRHRYCDDCRVIALKRRNHRPSRPPRDPAQHNRDYGRAHRKLRKAWGAKVELGYVRCSRCWEFISPSQQWDLDHNDEDRTRYNGPAHRYCNRAASNRGKARRFRLTIALVPSPAERRRRAAAECKRQRQAWMAARQEARKAEAVRRATEALVMRQYGHKWQYIADALGYVNTSGPWLLIRNTLRIDPKKIPTSA